MMDKEKKRSKCLNLLQNIFWPSDEEYPFHLQDDYSTVNSSSNSNVVNDSSATSNYEEQKDIEKQFEVKNVYSSTDVNLEYLKVKYNLMINSDIVLREFTLNARNKQFKAFLFFIDGMVNSELINLNILDPLMLRNKSNIYNNDQNLVVSEAVANNITVRRVKKFNIEDYISDCLLPQNNVKTISSFEDVFDGVNMGNCLLFVDTITTVFNIDVKGFKQRGIAPPNNEIIIRGSQEAFTEVIRTNTSLIRRMVNNENLVVESISVGNLSKTKCAVCYMKDLASNDLVAEVKFRLHNVNIDYLLSSGQLEQLIEDEGNYSLPQMIATERPDRVSALILEGRVAIIVNGSPFVLVVPGILTDFLSSSEDTNLKFQFSNLLKFIRVLAVLLTLFLPALYVAITNFHQELIPTKLLFSLVASREGVPFPTIIELLIMEISFELIREGGLRIPSAIGPTIGIVGALILGQSAVDAGIVSPILIIVVSVTAISSFAIPDFSLGFHCRIARFGYIFLGYLAGFLGLALGVCIHLFILANMKSFGVSYLEPYLPFSSNHSKGIFLSPAWKRERRQSFLNPKREQKQPHISMGWKYFK